MTRARARTRGISLGTSILLACLTAASPAGAQDAPAGPVTVTFPFTGAVQTLVVPSGVTSATFDVFGAEGGPNANSLPGGKGARTSATFTVTPGETLHVFVGGTRGPGKAEPTFGGGGGAPGISGGGGTAVAGAGGGASDVRRGGTALDARFIVAGGGGGAGGDASGESSSTVRGGAGGDAGSPGTAGSNGDSNGAAAGGSGGGPGASFAAGAGGTSSAGGATPGQPGTSGQGGAAPAGSGSAGWGGGGGGGYFGGGSGASGGREFAHETGHVFSAGGGGGGGSSHIAAGATAASAVRGVRTGAGLVTITYSMPPAGVTVTPAPEDAPAASGWFNAASSGTDGVRFEVRTQHGSEAITNLTCTSGPSTVLDVAGPTGSFVLQSGSHPVVCSARDASGRSVSGSGTFRVDQHAPSLSVAVSPNPVALLGSATAKPVATDSHSGVGVTACSALVTDTPGDRTVTCTADDVAGNRASATGAYRVLPRVCRSRRSFEIRLRIPAKAKVKRAKVTLAGKALRVRRRSGRYVATVRLSGRPKGRIVVRIEVTLRNGSRLRGIRTYNTCTQQLVGKRTPPV